jgi:uncharacterized YccA/Bax inhibitor family protein
VSGEQMTVDGTANKTGLLLLIALLPALFVWTRYFSGEPVGGLMILGGLGGLVVGIATSFKPEWSPITAPIYAALEGLVLGGLSALMDAIYPGIALQASGLTFGVLFVMLALYKLRIIRVTETFRTVIFAATGGIALVYLVSMVMRIFTGTPIPFIHEGGIVGIGFSLVVVGIAAFSLAMDFDFIETAAAEGAPKYMEWYGAFGLIVTLVWLYIELLRLLSKLRGDD